MPKRQAEEQLGRKDVAAEDGPIKPSTTSSGGPEDGESEEGPKWTPASAEVLATRKIRTVKKPGSSSAAGPSASGGTSVSSVPTFSFANTSGPKFSFGNPSGASAVTPSATGGAAPSGSPTGAGGSERPVFNFAGLAGSGAGVPASSGGKAGNGTSDTSTGSSGGVSWPSFSKFTPKPGTSAFGPPVPKETVFGTSEPVPNPFAKFQLASTGAASGTPFTFGKTAVDVVAEKKAENGENGASAKTTGDDDKDAKPSESTAAPPAPPASSESSTTQEGAEKKTEDAPAKPAFTWTLPPMSKPAGDGDKPAAPAGGSIFGKNMKAPTPLQNPVAPVKAVEATGPSLPPGTTGEEGEETVVGPIKGKAFFLDMAGDPPKYVERGIGQVKVNVGSAGVQEDGKGDDKAENDGDKNKSKRSARLLMRVEGSGRLVLNVRLYKGMKIEPVGAGKMIRFVVPGSEGAAFTTWALKFASVDDATSVREAITSQVAELFKD